MTGDPLYKQYHDVEWGVPFAQLKNPPYENEDEYLFEMLTLEGAQAGLSWLTILKRRENYRKAFDYFSVEKICQYDEAKVNELMQNKGIIRHELKIRSVINNAQAFMNVQDEFGSFHKYVWSFVNNEPIINEWRTASEVPTETKISKKLSNDLRKRGFTFIGPKICYAFMQAVGMVDDHTQDCFLY